MTEVPEGVGLGGTNGYLTREQRARVGERERGRTPLPVHADLSASNTDPVELLKRQAADLVPELVPIRYGRMLTSPFAFLRGAAAVMADDLSRGPSTSLVVQLCGDAHAGNFGLFASHERGVVFDINDFDETLPGPFEWDVKRLAASLHVAARANGAKKSKRREIVLAAVSAYRKAMHEFAREGNLRVWYAHVDVDKIMPELRKSLRRKRVKAAERSGDAALTRDSMPVLHRLSERTDEGLRLVERPPFVAPFHGSAPGRRLPDQWIGSLLAGYRPSLDANHRILLRQYRAVDLATSLVGVGSVGRRSRILLLEGLDPRDPLVLQVREAGNSSLANHLGGSPSDNAAERVVLGQKAMQAHRDIMLGWVRDEEDDGVVRSYYVRQLPDWKGPFSVEELPKGSLLPYGQLCGWTLARAHARTGDRVAIDAYLGATDEFDKAVANFASAYARKNDQDLRHLSEAGRNGRIEAFKE